MGPRYVTTCDRLHKSMFSLSSLTRRLGCFLRPPSYQALPFSLPRLNIFTRGRGQLAPKQVKHAKRHKGRIPIPIGGSTKGTTLAYGEWGIRITGNGARLSAKQLSTAKEVILKKLKIVKGARVFLRVFPDIPVCIKVSLFVFIASNCIMDIYREMKLVWVKGKGPLSSGRLGKQHPSFCASISHKFQRVNGSRNIRDRRSSHS